MKKNTRNLLAFCLLSLFVFSLTAVYITYPLVFHLGDYATGLGDELIISWIQSWIIHSFFTNPLELFNTNLYFPFKDTLAYSDLHLTSTFVSAIPYLLIGQPIALFNFTVLSSLILVPFSLFLLSFYLTKDYFASLLSGFLVQFSPAFLDKKVHIQILAVEWIPLAVLFFVLFHKRRGTKFFVLSLLFFVLQTYNSFIPGYFLIFFYVIYLFYIYFKDRQFLSTVFEKRNIASAVISVLFLLPIIIPYYQVSLEYHAKRDIRDTIHFAIQPEDLLYSGNTSRLNNLLMDIPYVKQISPVGEVKVGYLGFVFSVLCLVLFVYSFKGSSKNKLFEIFGITALIGFLLCLGPFLHINRVTIHKPFPIPLPYAILYYIAPGFQGFRDSERFELMFMLFIVIAITLMLVHLMKRFPFSWRIAGYIILIVGVIGEYNFPMQFTHVPQKMEFPKVYDWLTTTPQKNASIFMPAYDWYMYDANVEFLRDYYSTANWRPSVNGASGYAPPQWQQLIAGLHENFPNQESVKQLENWGVTYIIVDRNAYDKEFLVKQQPHDGSFVIQHLKSNSTLHLINQFGNYYVFDFVKK